MADVIEFLTRLIGIERYHGKTESIKELVEISNRIQKHKLNFFNRNNGNLETEKKIAIERVKKDIENFVNESSDLYGFIKKSDTYLIYSQKTRFFEKLDEYLEDLSFLEDRTAISSVKDSTDMILEIKNKITAYNDEFIKRRIEKYDQLFKKSPFSLDDDQKRAIVVDDKHNLVVAGAGSGKTEVLTTRIAYLIYRQPDSVDPDRILALAFQDKACEEMKKRLKERFNLEVEIKTFHSFGRSIITKARGKRPPLIFSGFNPDKEYTALINTLLDEAKKSSEFQKEVLNFVKYFHFNEKVKDESEFTNKKEHLEYLRSLRYTAINGEVVKSEAEREIWNFFLTHKLNGKQINVKYEDPARWMEYTDEHGERQWPKPDFFFPDHGIYLEHWALNKRGKVPYWFEGDNPTKKYKENMVLKKAKFNDERVNKKGYILVETYHGEYEERDFDNLLKRKMIEALGKRYPGKPFEFTQLTHDEILDKASDLCKASVKGLHTKISEYIKIAKTYNLYPQDIRRRLENNVWSPRQKAFAKVALTVFDKYQDKLESTRRIDFEDMINQAIEELKTNQHLFKNSFDHILIDEYQDISAQRYYLIKALMDKNPNCKLFCVGDDWQSIMGFSGSNLDYFVKFHDYFDHPARTDLTINYRSCKSIVDTGATIIKHNGTSQLKKEAVPHDISERPIRAFYYRTDWNSGYNRSIAEHCIDTIDQYLKKGYKPEEIMVLTRITANKRLKEELAVNAKRRGVPLSVEGKSWGNVPFMSVHKSKGLQARVVFVMNVTDDLYGFPCQLENQDIYDTAKEIGEPRASEEEERRLFYVAVTRAKEDVIIYSHKSKKSKFLDELQGHIVEKDLNSPRYHEDDGYPDLPDTQQGDRKEEKTTRVDIGQSPNPVMDALYEAKRRLEAWVELQGRLHDEWIGRRWWAWRWLGRWTLRAMIFTASSSWLLTRTLTRWSWVAMVALLTPPKKQRRRRQGNGRRGGRGWRTRGYYPRKASRYKAEEDNIW